jgi:hypothetical protein
MEKQTKKYAIQEAVRKCPYKNICKGFQEGFQRGRTEGMLISKNGIRIFEKVNQTREKMKDKFKEILKEEIRLQQSILINGEKILIEVEKL